MIRIIKAFIQLIFDGSFNFIDEVPGVLDDTPVADGLWVDAKLWVDVKQWIDQG